MELKKFIEKLQVYQRIVDGSPHKSCGNIEFWIDEDDEKYDLDLEFSEFDLLNTVCGCECNVVLFLKVKKEEEKKENENINDSSDV